MESKTWRASRFGVFSFLLCAASLLLFLNVRPSPGLSSQSWWKRSAYSKRADKGDVYLLGVGKADITGYAFRNAFMGPN
jgi:hypothetical protein